MKTKRKRKNEIILEYFHTGKVNRPIYFSGTQKEAEEFCKKNYRFAVSCLLNGVEQIKK